MEVAVSAEENPGMPHPLVLTSTTMCTLNYCKSQWAKRKGSTMDSKNASDLSGQANPRATLMSIPFELRLQIYELLMDTGKTVHIGHPARRSVEKRKFGNVCMNPESDLMAYTAIKRTPQLSRQPADRRHRVCCVSKGLSATLALTRASKAINWETMGVILGNNTFTFSEPEDMERFMKRLPLRQHCLIKRVTVYVLGNQPSWCKMSHQWMFERLTGLKHINVYLELTHGHLAMIKQDYRNLGSYGVDSLIRILFVLAEFPLTSADVRITPPMAQDYSDNTSHYDAISQAEIRKWEDHVRGKIRPGRILSLEEWLS